MSFDSLLINTCTIKKLVQGPGIDDYGHPVVSWTDVPNQNCRLTTPTGREIKVGAEVVVADYEVFLGDVDIDEQDRIVIGSTSFEVLLVADRQDSMGSHHREVWVRTVR